MNYSIEDKIFYEVVKLLYIQGKWVIAGSLITATCFVYGLHHIIPNVMLFSWYGALLFISFVRFLLIKAYFLRQPSLSSTKIWYTAFLTVTICSGVLWAAASLFIVPHSNAAQVLVAFGIAAVAAGAIPFFSPSKTVFTAFVVLVLPCFGIRMILVGDTSHQLVGLLSFIYLLTLLIVSYRIQNQISSALKVKLKNNELIERLFLTKNEVESVNKELQIEINERKDIENLLRNSEEQYRLVTNALPVLIAYIDTHFHFRFNNKAYEEWLNKPLDEITGTSIKKTLGDAWFSLFNEHYSRLLAGEQVTYETIMYFHDDEERYVSVTLIPHLKENHTLCGIFSLISDMTPRINFLATHDSLTGLPNRSLFNARLSHSIRHANRTKLKVALLYLDLDHFKDVNDSLGHDIGDQLLIKVVDRLKSCVFEGDMIARIGGDEFTIILEGLVDMQRVDGIAKKVCHALADAFMMNDRELYITTSIGISIYPNDAKDMTILLKNADMAMYRAKEQGRNTFEFYTQKMNETVQKKIAIEANIRSALEKQEFKLYYQPIIDIKHNTIKGVEALVRWFSPKMGLVTPADFIPIAEKTDLIVPIGDWILRTACVQNLSWHDAGHVDFRMSVNISTRQFMKSDFIIKIKKLINETGLEGKFLTLEVTEGLIMSDIDYSIKMIKMLKELGITISLDDFGSGYSSLTYLKHFPLDFIKIDRHFISDFAINRGDAAIVKAVIALSHNLNMKVVAECVETPDQYLFLKEQGCDEVQGYLFYPPLPSLEISSLLSSTSQAIPRELV